MGGQGLFVKELETALLDGRADLAVHSLKDVPVDLHAPFALCAVLERADPRDAFVSSSYGSLAELPAGAVVGTSSLRRESQIRARYPHLVVQPLRGNLDTRLGKLDRGDYAAIVLAAAGLQRLDLGGRIRALLDPEDSLPAAGAGCAGHRDPAPTAPSCTPGSRRWRSAGHRRLYDRRAQRLAGAGRLLPGPLAAYARIEHGELALRAPVASPDGLRIARAEQRGSVARAEAVGAAAARQLLDGGGRAILDDVLRAESPPDGTAS